MENGIQIVIMGPPASGKTTVAQEMVDKLRDLGFAVKWDVKPDYESESKARKAGLNRLNRLEAVMEKTPIIVKEIITKRDFNASLNYRVSDYVEPKTKGDSNEEAH